MEQLAATTKKRERLTRRDILAVACGACDGRSFFWL